MHEHRGHHAPGFNRGQRWPVEKELGEKAAGQQLSDVDSDNDAQENKRCCRPSTHGRRSRRPATERSTQST